jgi:hypothetical protein
MTVYVPQRKLGSLGSLSKLTLVVYNHYGHLLRLQECFPGSLGLPGLGEIRTFAMIFSARFPARAITVNRVIRCMESATAAGVPLHLRATIRAVAIRL